MRVLALLLLLAVPLGVSAQPTLAPADEARIDRVLDALQIDRQVEASMSRLATDPMMGEAVDAITPATIRAAVRARLVESYSRERAEAVLADGSGVGDYLDRYMAMESPEALSLSLRYMVAPPKKGVLADSAEAVRFVQASGLGPFSRDLLTAVFTGLAERSPDARAELDATGSTIAELVHDQLSAVEGVAVQMDRLAPRTASKRRALAYAASDAGQWAIAATLGGFHDAYVAPLTDALVASFEQYQRGR